MKRRRDTEGILLPLLLLLSWPGRAKVCPEPAWWRASEQPCTAADDPLALLEPRFSAAEVCSAVTGLPRLVCPDGSVLVDSWVERRDTNASDARLALIAPAPDPVDACFGRQSCELPPIARGLCQPPAEADAQGEALAVAADGEQPNTASASFRAAVAASCAPVLPDGSLLPVPPAPDPAAASASAAAAAAASAAQGAAAADSSRSGDDDDDGDQAEAVDHIIPLEEWKARVLAKIAAEEPAARPEQATAGDDAPAPSDGAAGSGSSHMPPSDTAQLSSSRTAADAASSPNQNNHARAQRLPLAQRFNYAAFDAGARLVAANPEAKGANAILKGDRDQYVCLAARRLPRLPLALRVMCGCSCARGYPVSAAGCVAVALHTRHSHSAPATRPHPRLLLPDRYMLNPCSARKWVVIALPEDIKVRAAAPLADPPPPSPNCGDGTPSPLPLLRRDLRTRQPSRRPARAPSQG